MMLRVAIEYARTGAEPVAEEFRVAAVHGERDDFRANVAWWLRVARAWHDPLTPYITPSTLLLS